MPLDQAPVPRDSAIGIETLIHDEAPPYLQTAVAGIGLPRGSCPVAERIAGEGLSLPMDALLDPAQVDAVIATVLAWDETPAADPGRGG
jgi:dTDP-4-amino-4,6-dideoxygalactose transaminase